MQFKTDGPFCSFKVNFIPLLNTTIKLKPSVLSEQKGFTFTIRYASRRLFRISTFLCRPLENNHFVLMSRQFTHSVFITETSTGPQYNSLQYSTQLGNSDEMLHK